MQRRFVHLNGKNYMCTGVPVMWIYRQKEGTIILDPTVSVTKDAISDTWIAKGAPNNNYGTHTLLNTGANTSSKVRSLLKFSLSSIPSTATVLSSKIKLYYDGHYPSNSTSTLKCYQLKKNWNELETTWINSTVSESGSTPWHVQGVGLDNIDAKSTPEDAITINGVVEWKYLNITELTKEWIRGEATNYGVLLVDTEEDNGTYREKRYRSRDYSGTTYDPKLEIVYMADPIAVYEYDAGGKPTTVTYANGAVETNTYNPVRDWITSRHYKDPSANTIVKFQSTNSSDYDLTGNLKKQVVYRNSLPTVTMEYVYDNLNRIKTFKYNGSEARSYTYDDNGNILSMSTKSFTYANHNNQITSDGTRTFQYDKSGRMSTLSGASLEYDMRNNLRNYPPVGYYRYNADNQRIMQIENGLQSLTTYYVKSGGTTLAEYDYNDNNTAEYIYGLDGIIAKYNASTHTYYWFYKDNLGSTRQVGPASGTLYSKTQYTDYYPFGEEYTSSGTETDYRFTGKEKDNTGLLYFGARYYDPSIGRFLTPDPMANNRPWMTPYHYCQNNPLSRIDPDGRVDKWAFTWSTVEFVGAGIGIGAGISGIITCAGGTGISYGGFSIAAGPGLVLSSALYLGSLGKAAESMYKMSLAWKTPDGMEVEEFKLIKYIVAGLNYGQTTQEVAQLLYDAFYLIGVTNMTSEGFLHLWAILSATGATTDDIISPIKALEDIDKNESNNGSDNADSNKEDDNGKDDKDDEEEQIEKIKREHYNSSYTNPEYDPRNGG